MTELNDKEKRFRHLLHAFELGLLNEQEREEFEMLLLENNAFFDEVKNSRPVINILKEDESLQRLAARLGQDSSDRQTYQTEELPSEHKPGRIRWSLSIPVSIAAVIIFLMLILGDWKLEIGPEQNVIAAENKLAVLYFRNISNPADTLNYNEIISNLLITNLSEVYQIPVFSHQYINDLKELMFAKKGEETELENAVALAREARVQRFITGSIIQQKNQWSLTADLFDTKTGKLISTRKVVADTNTSIFTMVDRLSAKIGLGLVPPEIFQSQRKLKVAEATTSSFEAYRAYLQGIEQYNKFYYDSASYYFRQALTFDSTFAMAYYYLARLDDKKFIEQAVKYSANIPLKEKYYIQSYDYQLKGDLQKASEILLKLTNRFPDEKEAYFLLGRINSYWNNYQQAIHFYREAIRIDPQYKLVYNQLAYQYNELNDFEKALWALNKYIELAPGEANPYDSRADIFRLNGQLQKAIESYNQALRLKPDFYSSLANLGLLYVFSRDYEKADSTFKILAALDDKTLSSAARLFLAYIPCYQRQYSEALRRLNEGIRIDKLKSQNLYGEISTAYKYQLKSLIFAELNMPDSALNECRQVEEIWKKLKPGDIPLNEHLQIELLSKIGFKKEVESRMKRLEKIRSENESIIDVYEYSRGAIDFANEDYPAALSHFREATKYNTEFSFSYMLALAELRNGNNEEAARIFESLLKKYYSPRMYLSIKSVNMHYYLASAYEHLHQNEKAIEQYKLYIDILQNAEVPIPELNDAKSRLTHLENQS